MDADRFDALSRALSTAHTRRRLTRLLGGLSLGGVLSVRSITDAGAALRLGGAPCTKNTQCQTGRCVGRTGNKKCSCSTTRPRVGCQQPDDPCKRAVCNVETQRCVTKNKTGSCPGGTCQNGTCTPTCTPTTCAELGLACGTVSDGCEGQLECGGCDDDNECTLDTCEKNGSCMFTADPSMDDQPCRGGTGTCHGGECIPDPVCGNGLCEAGECDLCPDDCGVNECLPTVADVSVSPDPVLIGSSSQGTVTLNRASQGDTTVTLSVNDSNAASVPGTATVPDGATTSTTFPVTGLEPRDEVVLSATLGSASVQTTFAVKNPGQ